MGRRTSVVVAALALLLGACAREEVPAAPELRVAATPDAESLLLSEVAVVLLGVAGITADTVVLADSRSTRRAIEVGDVDLVVAYSGEEWLTRLGRADPPADPLEAFPVLAESDLGRGLTWLIPAGGPGEDPGGTGGAGGSGGPAGPGGPGAEGPPANATFAFFVAGPPSIDADLRSISQLSLRLSERPELSLCVDAEFGRRADGLSALLSTYSVRRDRPFLAAGPEEGVGRVRAGDCVAGLSHATDGRAWAAGMLPLVDDLRFFPAFVPAPVVRTGTLLADVRVGPALAPMGELTTALLGRANGAVTAGAGIEQTAEELAGRLLERLDARRGDLDGPDGPDGPDGSEEGAR